MLNAIIITWNEIKNNKTYPEGIGSLCGGRPSEGP